MKTYKNLWNDFISDDNIRRAIIKSSRGKRNRRDVRRIYNDIDHYILKIREYVINFKRVKHTLVEINDGASKKKRQIIVPSYMEQILHHMVINILEPIFMKGMYEHSYGSIPNRGGYKGMKQVKKWISKGGRNIKFCLKMDIKKFYQSIPKDIIKSKFTNMIKDKKFLHIIYEIIESSDNGLPIGFYTSQWFANWYLQDLDHYIKEELKAVYYIRYIDDMVIFGPNKRELHKIRHCIESYLNNKLGLEMKKNWQTFRFDYIRKGVHKGRFLDFLGFRFYRDRVTLRRTLMLRACRKAKKISKKSKPTIYDAMQMVSYVGWIKHTDTYGMYLKRIKPYVNIQNLKRKISEYSKMYNNTIDVVNK